MKDSKTMKGYLRGYLTVHKSSNATSLLERIRQKEAALRMVKSQQDPERDKRVSIIQSLQRSVVEVVFGHFRHRKVRGMELNALRPLVSLSCGTMDRVSFTEHINTLCALCPEVCSVESYRGRMVLKIADVEDGVDAVLRQLGDELARLG